LPIGGVVTTATLEGLSLIDQLQLGDVRTKLEGLRKDFNLQIPHKEDLSRIQASLRRWRNQQLLGDSPAITREAAENLLERVGSIELWLQEQGPAAPAADVTRLRTAIETLRDAAPGSVQSDNALAQADAEFRDFKRNLLGGTYRAWLTEAANPTDEQIEQLRRNLLAAVGPAVSFGGDTLKLALKLIFGILIMIAALFFFLAEGSKMLVALIRISPLEEQHVRELVSEFNRACRAIVSATLLSAVVQGLLAGIGFYFAGLRGSVALLMLLTMVLSLVPFTGAAAVWIPTSLYLYFYEGNMVAAIGLALYGVCIISSSDNFIKPLVLSGQSNLHPLLALLSVIGGLQALGPIGIVVGPMVVVFLQTLLKLLQRELSSIDRSSWTFWRGFGGPGGMAPATAPPLDEPPAGEVPPEIPATDIVSPAPAASGTSAASSNGSTEASVPRRTHPSKPAKKRRK
jgi:predicted PurR-regulated permease PerM